MPAPISKAVTTPTGIGTGARPVDLDATLARAGQLATKADVAVVLKTGVSASALADALIARTPSTQTATADFVSQLRDALQSEADKIKGTPGQKPSQKLLERIAGLDTLAKSLAPAATETPKPSAAAVAKDQVAAPVIPDKTAAQTANDKKTNGHAHSHVAKRQGKSNLGFEATDKTDATAATAEVAAKPPADINGAYASVRSQIEQIDYMLQTLPEGDKKDAYNALVGGTTLPESGDKASAAIDAFKANVQTLTGSMSPDEQRGFFKMFNINYDVAMAAKPNGGANGAASTSTGLNLSSAIKPNAMDPKNNPAVGSRMSALDTPQILGADQPGQQPQTGPATSSLPPTDQLAQIFVKRLSKSSIQPTQLDAINWRNPLGDSKFTPLGRNGVPQYAPPGGGAAAAAATATPMPGKLDALFKTFGNSISAEQMTSFLKQAKGQGISPENIVDGILSGSGPFGQLVPRMADGGKTLVDAMNKKDPKFEQRIHDLSQLASQGVQDGNPTNPGNLIGQADIAALLSKGGATPMQLGAQILANKGPLAGRLTQDAVAAVIDSIDPKAAKTQAEADAAMNMADSLRKLMPSLPAGVGAVGAGASAQQGFIQQALNGIMSNPFMNRMGTSATGALATAAMGFIPTGNTSLDLANAIANSPTYSPTEQSLLDQIQDPQQRAMQALQMQMQKQALLATMLTNLANMRFESLKAVAQNFRG